MQVKAANSSVPAARSSYRQMENTSLPAQVCTPTKHSTAAKLASTGDGASVIVCSLPFPQPRAVRGMPTPAQFGQRRKPARFWAFVPIKAIPAKAW